MAFWETAEERNPLRARERFRARRRQLEFARIWKQLPKLVFLEVARGSRGKRAPLSSAQGRGRRADRRGRRRASRDSHTAQLIDEYHLFVEAVALASFRNPRPTRRTDI